MRSLGRCCQLLLLGSIAALLPSQEDVRQETLRLAGEAIQSGRNSQAIRYLHSLRGAASDPGVSHMLAVAHSRLAVAKQQDGDLRGALRSIQAAIRLEPNEVGLLLSLGSLQMRLGDRRAAEKRFRQVLALQPDQPHALAMLAERSKQRREHVSGYEQRRSGAFILQYPGTNKVRAALPEIENLLKVAHRDLRRHLAAAPRNPVEIMLYDGQAFKQLSQAQHWAQAYYDGKIRLNLDSSAGLRSGLRRTMRHELAHAYLHELYGQLPLWIHEGFAQVIEGRAVRAAGSRFRNGDELLAGELFLSGYAGSRHMDVVDKGYAQSVMAVGFLLQTERRRGQFRRLLAELGGGANSEDALRAVYGLGVTEMLEAAKRNR